MEIDSTSREVRGDQRGLTPAWGYRAPGLGSRQRVRRLAPGSVHSSNRLSPICSATEHILVQHLCERDECLWFHFRIQLGDGKGEKAECYRCSIFYYENIEHLKFFQGGYQLPSPTW